MSAQDATTNDGGYAGVRNSPDPRHGANRAGVATASPRSASHAADHHRDGAGNIRRSRSQRGARRRRELHSAPSADRWGRRTLTPETIGSAERAISRCCKAIDRQQETPERIYVDPTLPATLQHDGEAHECHTLEEAVLAWLHLPERRARTATIQVNVPNGPLYTAAEIDRLHIRAEHQRD